MWHILNPKLDDSVPREKVEEFLSDLVYISVDMMIKYISVMGLSLKEKGTTTVNEVARQAKGLDARNETKIKDSAIIHLKKLRKH